MTAATTGLGIRATAVNEDCSAPERLTMSVYDMSAISLMSAPAAKTRSPPYTTTALTSSRSVASVAAARISSWTCDVEGVHLRPVQPDRADAVGNLQSHELAHGHLLVWRSRSPRRTGGTGAPACVPCIGEQWRG